MPTGPLKVFISYTAQDLAEHARVVRDELRAMQWLAVDHIDWAPTGEPSVQACREKVAGCALMVLLVAHRYGYVPSAQLGGDGRTSITRMEYQWAREWRIPVVLFLCDEQDGWPEAMIEGHGTPAIHEPLEDFKKELRNHILEFFTHEPESILGKLRAGLTAAGESLTPEGKSPGSQRSDILPVKLPYLCDRSQQSRLVRQRLQSHLQSNATRPLLFLLHGNADEAHSAFVERVEGHVLPELLASTGSRRESRFCYLPQLEVATTHSLGADFRVELSSKMAQLDHSSDAKLIDSLRTTRLRSMVVVWQMSASECRRAPTKVLQTVGDYWDRFPDLPSDLMLACFLCIKYDKVSGLGPWVRKLTGRGTSDDQVRGTVETLAASVADQSGPLVCVLPELKSVTRRDIDDWMHDVRSVLRRHVSEQEFGKMFDDGQSLPMDAAIRHLEGVLDSQPPRS